MKKFLGLLCLAASISAGAQQVISMKDIIAAVAQNYPSIKAKQAGIKAAAYYTNAAKKDYLPDLVVGDQYTYSTNNGLVGSFYNNEGSTISTSGGVRPDNIYQGVFGSFTTLTVDWKAFNFGKIKQGVQYAQAQQLLAQDDYQNEIFKQEITAADAYLQLALLLKLQTVQQQNLDRAITFQQYILSRAGAGLIPGADSSYANAEVAKARLALLQSRQNAAQQKIVLAQLSGIKADSILADTSFFLKQLPTAFSNDSLSVQSHPYLQYAQQQVKVLQEKSLVVKKAVLPTVNILGMGWARGSGVDKSGNYSSKISDGIPYQAYNYMAAVAVKWNITSLAKNKQERRAAEQETEASKFRMSEQELALQSQLNNATLQYDLALQQTKVAPVQYQSAYDAYQQSNARYQAGLATLTELVQTLYVLNRADVDKAVANNNVWRGLLMQTAATGNLSLFTNQLP